MKIIATIVATIALLFGGTLTPASAEEPAPVDCEETVQEWKDRAMAAEARAAALSSDLFFAQAAAERAERQAAILEAQLDFTEEHLADTRAHLIEKQQQFYRQFNKITRQRLTILRLRDRLQAMRD